MEAQHENSESLDQILVELDKRHNSSGMKPSEAWQYRETIRIKYGLPECGYRWNDPLRYIGEIETFLKSNGVTIRPKHEFQNFFAENSDSGALTSGPSVFRDLTIIVQGESDDWYKLRARANQLAHESVHAMQNIKYPSMTNEEAEREAYFYQMLTPQELIEAANKSEGLGFLLALIEKNVINSKKTDERLHPINN